MADNLQLGWQLLVLGMGTVFLMLFLLSFLLKYSGRYFDNKRSQKTVKDTKSPAEKTTTVNHSTTNTNKEAEVAAVMAAIQAVMGGNSNYKVTSIKKRSDSSWKSISASNDQGFNYGGRKGK